MGRSLLKLTKPFIGITLLGCVAIVLLTFLPGLGNLGYFSALGISVIVAFFSPHLGVELMKGHTSPISATRLVALSLAPSFALSFFCAGWMLLHPSGSETCDWVLGSGFFFLGPFLTCHLGVLVGLIIGFRQRASWPHARAIFLTLLLCLWELLYFYKEPAVFSYSPLFGYFAGPIYDAAVPISFSYGGTRLFQVSALWLAAILAFSTAKGKGRVLVCVLLTGIVSVGLYSPPSWGFSGRQRMVDAVLDHEFRSGNIVVHARAKNDKERRKAENVLEDARARYAELRSFFGTEPAETLHIYFYPSQAIQRTLMGAGRVRIAKPWLGQVHLSRLKERAPVLKHEMAHVFGAELIDHWLGIPTSFGFLPKMALVEGLATSLEGRRGDRSLHQWSAALREIEKLPRISAMMGPQGYTSTYGPTAYTAAGSFLLFLDERYGRTKFLSLYAGHPFDQLYGKSLNSLEEEWWGFLSRDVSVGASVLNEARFAYDRKAVLKRRCPVVVARLERQAALHTKKGAWPEALLLREEICEMNPKDTVSRIRKAWSLAGVGRFDESLSLLLPISQDDSETAGIRSRAAHALADILWLSEKPAEASVVYEELLDEPLNAASHRSIWIKQKASAAADEPWAQAIRDYLVNSRLKGKERRAILRESVAAHPNHPLLLYLSGKLDLIRGKPAEAVAALERAFPSMTYPLLRGEALRSLGIALTHTQSPDKAIQIFRDMEAALPSDREGLIAEARDWLLLAQFKVENP